MIVELDRKGLANLVRGSELSYDEFDNPLVKKAGHRYSQHGGISSWDTLSALTDVELYELYLLCRKRW